LLTIRRSDICLSSLYLSSCLRPPPFTSIPTILPESR